MGWKEKGGGGEGGDKMLCIHCKVLFVAATEAKPFNPDLTVFIATDGKEAFHNQAGPCYAHITSVTFFPMPNEHTKNRANSLASKKEDGGWGVGGGVGWGGLASGWVQCLAAEALATRGTCSIDSN